MCSETAIRKMVGYKIKIVSCLPKYGRFLKTVCKKGSNRTWYYLGTNILSLFINGQKFRQSDLHTHLLTDTYWAPKMVCKKHAISHIYYDMIVHTVFRYLKIKVPFKGAHMPEYKFWLDVNFREKNSTPLILWYHTYFGHLEKLINLKFAIIFWWSKRCARKTVRIYFLSVRNTALHFFLKTACNRQKWKIPVK